MTEVKCPSSPSIGVTVDTVVTGFVGPHASLQMVISLGNVPGVDVGKEFGRFSSSVLKLRTASGKALLANALSTVISQLDDGSTSKETLAKIPTGVGALAAIKSSAVLAPLQKG